MSLYRSRFLLAAAAVAALAAFGAGPVLAAGMANSEGSMMSTHDSMASDTMPARPLAQNHGTKVQHEKPMQTTNSSAMKAAGSTQ